MSPRPSTIDVPTVRHLLGAGAVVRLIDVRTPAEFETVHIPGAYNVPLDLLSEHRTELRTHLDDQVVLVCRSGARATRAGNDLASAGLPQLRVLEGGMVAWEATGAPVNRGRPRWDLERQVRLVAGTIVLLSALAALVVPAALWIAAAVGGGLAVAALTHTCAMGMLLSRLPYNRTRSCDLDTVVAELREGRPGRTRS